MSGDISNTLTDLLIKLRLSVNSGDKEDIESYFMGKTCTSSEFDNQFEKFNQAFLTFFSQPNTLNSLSDVKLLKLCRKYLSFLLELIQIRSEENIEILNVINILTKINKQSDEIFKMCTQFFWYCVLKNSQSHCHGNYMITALWMEMFESITTSNISFESGVSIFLQDIDPDILPPPTSNDFEPLEIENHHYNISNVYKPMIITQCVQWYNKLYKLDKPDIENSQILNANRYHKYFQILRFLHSIEYTSDINISDYLNSVQIYKLIQPFEHIKTQNMKTDKIDISFYSEFTEYFSENFFHLANYQTKTIAMYITHIPFKNKETILQSENLNYLSEFYNSYWILIQDSIYIKASTTNFPDVDFQNTQKEVLKNIKKIMSEDLMPENHVKMNSKYDLTQGNFKNSITRLQMAIFEELYENKKLFSLIFPVSYPISQQTPLQQFLIYLAKSLLHQEQFFHYLIDQFFDILESMKSDHHDQPLTDDSTFVLELGYIISQLEIDFRKSFSEINGNVTFCNPNDLTQFINRKFRLLNWLLYNSITWQDCFEDSTKNIKSLTEKLMEKIEKAAPSDVVDDERFDEAPTACSLCKINKSNIALSCGHLHSCKKCTLTQLRQCLADDSVFTCNVCKAKCADVTVLWM